LRVRVVRKFKILEGWCELGWKMMENIVMDQNDINEVRQEITTDPHETSTKEPHNFLSIKN